MDASDVERLLNGMTDEEKKNLRGFFVSRLPRRDDPDDAISELFRRVFRDIAQVKDAHAFWGWFWTIAGNVAKDVAKKGKKQRKRFAPSSDAFEEDATEPEGGEDDPSEQAAAREKQRRVREALAKLPEDERRALELKFFSGLEQTQIAEALGWTLSQVKNALRGGYERMNRILEDMDI